MPGTVITLSPRMPMDSAVGLVYRRLAADDVAWLAVATADRGQVRNLRRLRARLLKDSGLEVFYADQLDGSTALTVFRAGGPRPGVWGEARIG